MISVKCVILLLKMSLMSLGTKYVPEMFLFLQNIFDVLKTLNFTRFLCASSPVATVGKSKGIT